MRGKEGVVDKQVGYAEITSHARAALVSRVMMDFKEESKDRSILTFHST